MVTNKINNNIFSVLATGIKIYFSNMDKFFIYMLFPVFGQIIGITLALCFPLLFSSKIIHKTTSISSALLFVFLLAIPGILIFVKAFWDYMVAYVALNSMTEGAVVTGKVYDFAAHNEVATRRTIKYMCFLIVLSFLCALASTIFFIVPGVIMWIYFILVFQVFTFEPELSVKECYKRSYFLIKGSWVRTVFILLFLIFFSIYIITQGITVIFDYLNLTGKICSIFNFIGQSMPLDKINGLLLNVHMPLITVKMVSNWVFSSVLTFIVMGLTLPIRSICWSLWYKSLCDKKDKSTQETRKTKKRHHEE